MKEDVEEDKGKSMRDRTKQEIVRMMNSINEDLKFTTEVEEDFGNGRLPTLDMEICVEGDYRQENWGQGRQGRKEEEEEGGEEIKEGPRIRFNQ